MNDETKTYAADLLLETREEIARADTKAAILFTAFGIAVAAILAGLIAGSWSPKDLDRGATVVFWVGSGSAFLAFTALGYALWPRIKHKNAAQTASYYLQIRKYDGLSDLRTALKQGAESGDRTVAQLKVTSDIAWRKFVGIRLAMVLYGFGVAACCGAVIFG
ncbi:MAG TPA: Pycsar system effector family protein [Solirubrobacterales bacterium]|jgi:MFS family permease|nr:Pycsar system effector family protein [Solirubrobacterales bacterium]